MNIGNHHKSVDVNFESLLRIFTIPEDKNSTLGQIEQELSNNLNLFLKEHIVAEEKPLSEIEKVFSSTQIPQQPEFVSKHTQHLMDNLVAHSVHTSSPSFIGHMTSALPYFLMPLSKIMIALNQNLVKIETSKAFTPLERQVLGMLHHLIYQKEAPFYQKWMHDATHPLGAFCSGGTVANITALWVARNLALKPTENFSGIDQEGIAAALQYYGYNGMAILVSHRGHYSLKKAANVLGIGQQNLVSVETDENHRICLTDLELKINQLIEKKIKPFAIIGVAGTTETGNIDPLEDIAKLAQKYDCHFHVDAAWGGATLMSQKHKKLLKGIEQADSVTIDAHKQLYIPMGAGMVLFRSSNAMKAIEHHAQYILRKGSKDLGAYTLEGSRSGMAMLVYASLHILGQPGYQLLIDHSIEQAQFFAENITRQDDFELISKPELCLLTYRYSPKVFQNAWQFASQDEQQKLSTLLNQLTMYIQKAQREAGQSFVSRTQIPAKKYQMQETVVFRVVLANPLTSREILDKILLEQREIAQDGNLIYSKLIKTCQEILKNKS